MPGSGDEPPRRRSLTPIGDELHPADQERHSEASRLARLRGRADRLRRRPANRLGSIAYGLALFVILLVVVGGLAYLVARLFDHPYGLSDDLTSLVVFLVLAAVTGAIAAGSAHPAFGIALAIAFFAVGFGLWGRGTQAKDTFPDELAAIVAPDWGRHSATCRRHHGSVSLCTVQDEGADPFRVCVSWTVDPGFLLVYVPLQKCGVDAVGLTVPPVRMDRFRATATANCLARSQATEVIEATPVEPFTETSTHLLVTFRPPHQLTRSVLDAYFMRDTAEAKHWFQGRAESLSIPRELRGKALYRRRNAVMQWGNPSPASTSIFNACLRT